MAVMYLVARISPELGGDAIDDVAYRRRAIAIMSCAWPAWAVMCLSESQRIGGGPAEEINPQPSKWRISKKNFGTAGEVKTRTKEEGAAGAALKEALKRVHRSLVPESHVSSPSEASCPAPSTSHQAANVNVKREASRRLHRLRAHAPHNRVVGITLSKRVMCRQKSHPINGTPGSPVKMAAHLSISL